MFAASGWTAKYMFPLRALLLLVAVLCALPAGQALAVDPGKVGDWLKDKAKEKGVDWLKDQAKQAAEDWVFDTGQSTTMEAILNKCQEATGNTRGLASLHGCELVAVFEAINVLSDINSTSLGKDIAKTAFDAALKTATIGAGAAGAAAEGGLLSWL